MYYSYNIFVGERNTQGKNKMKKAFIYGDRAKYYVIMDGEYATDWLSKAKAEKHAKNLRLLGFHAVVVRDLSVFN